MPGKRTRGPSGAATAKRTAESAEARNKRPVQAQASNEAHSPDESLKRHQSKAAKAKWDKVRTGELPASAKGGRKRTDAPRCACGTMTARLAQIKFHKCA